MLTSILAFSATETCLFCERGEKKATQKKILKEVKVSPGLRMGEGSPRG